MGSGRSWSGNDEAGSDGGVAALGAMVDGRNEGTCEDGMTSHFADEEMDGRL
jgi:hypothetical protein